MAWQKWRRWKPSGAAALCLLFFASVSNLSAYSVLTHEAIVDALWDTSIRAVLLQHFPKATPEELLEAHAYAYGGSIIQDLGYYPFGSVFYTDLTHYTRSGDFILSLLRNSQDLNEYAFSLGALAHYAADSDGHSLATNVAVPLLYPKLKLRFGNHITYADDPLSHSKTEFAFDVFQASKSRYASDGYKAFIGFQVSKPVLQRAFLETYGIPIEKIFVNFDLAVGSYRRAVGTILPAMTRIAWQINKDEIRKEAPGITRQKFLYNLSRSSYEKNWGSTYTKPGWRSRFLAVAFRIMPKVGPFKPLVYKPLTPAIEQMYMKSFNTTLDHYRVFLDELKANRLILPNQNFDVGTITPPGKYKLADETYAKLLHKLHDHYLDISQDLRNDILAYYRDLNAPITTKAHSADWNRVLDELAELKAVNQDITGQPAESPQSPPDDPQQPEVLLPVTKEIAPPSVKALPKAILLDQKQIWTSPFHMKREDAKWWLGFGAITGTLIATDHLTYRQLPNTRDQIAVSSKVSQLGSAYGLIPLVGAFYLGGALIKDSKLSQTGLLGGEALADALIVSEVLKVATGRLRPWEGDGGGHFFHSGVAFPSGHSTESFAFASVIAHQYSGNKAVALLAYGFATAISASRFSARQHSASDIVAGGAIGWFIGTHVFETHQPLGQSPSRAKAWLSPQIVPQVSPSSHSYGLSLLWHP